MIYKEHILNKKKIRVLITCDQIKPNLPVIYMHDGQNLFDDKNATFGVCWGFKQVWKKNDFFDAIIIGIDSDSERLNEYCPFKSKMIEKYANDKNLTGGKGDKYLEFIVKVVKPFVEKEYFATKDQNLIAIGGSSLGGYISTYALIKYPQHFTRALCLSNAYWCELPLLVEFIKNNSITHINKIYIDVGNKESSKLVENATYLKANRKIVDALSKKNIGDKMIYREIEGGQHNEASWRARLDSCIRSVYSDIWEKLTNG